MHLSLEREGRRRFTVVAVASRFSWRRRGGARRAAAQFKSIPPRTEPLVMPRQCGGCCRREREERDEPTHHRLKLVCSSVVVGSCFVLCFATFLMPMMMMTT